MSETKPYYRAPFWTKVAKGAPDECWPWLGYKKSGGHRRSDYNNNKGFAMRELLLIIILLAAICFGLSRMQRHQKPPPPQDTHTGILKGTPYDARRNCDPSEMTPECNGSKP